MTAAATRKRTIGQAVADLRSHPARSRLEQYDVGALKKALPPGSRWMWGDRGKPDCQVCRGLGYVRLGDLPVSHRDFGRLFLCECCEEKS